MFSCASQEKNVMGLDVLSLNTSHCSGKSNPSCRICGIHEAVKNELELHLVQTTYVSMCYGTFCNKAGSTGFRKAFVPYACQMFCQEVGTNQVITNIMIPTQTLMINLSWYIFIWDNSLLKEVSSENNTKLKHWIVSSYPCLPHVEHSTLCCNITNVGCHHFEYLGKELLQICPRQALPFPATPHFMDTPYF